VAASLAMFLPSLAFGQAELTVFVGGAVTQPVKEVGTAFARSSGSTLVYVTDTTGALSKRLGSGEKADLIVVTSAAIDALEKNNQIVKGTKVDPRG
jgi:ABC-type molybdate transport system substrate-binding protein